MATAGGAPPTAHERDATAIEEKMQRLNAAYRTFATATNAIAKDQRKLLTHLHQLLNEQKIKEHTKKLQSL